MLDLRQSLNIARSAKLATILLMGVCLAGCFSRQVSPEYPASWSPQDKSMIGSCPSIAGIYRNLGESGPSGVECGGRSRYGFGHDHGEWNCSPELLRNLGIVDQADSVVIEQPSESLLELKFRDVDGNVVGSEVLRRGWSFNCEGVSLTFSKVAPLGGADDTYLGFVITWRRFNTYPLISPSP